MFASYGAILLLLLYRIVPADCRGDGAMWDAIAMATLPLPIVIALALVVLSAGRRMIRGKTWRALGVFAWLWFALHLAALAVLIGGHVMFNATLAEGLLVEASPQCLSRMCSDYLNATGGFLFWYSFIAIVAAGAIQLLPARPSRARQTGASTH